MAVENLITEHIDIWTSAVKTKSASGRGSSKKLELYGVKKLRELILELAVRGKLVPQDPSDEPASVLLERIAAEKAQLVKERKITKPKKLAEVCDDEFSFELPSNWDIRRLPEVYYTISPSGKKLKSSDVLEDGTYPVIDQGQEAIAGYSNDEERVIDIESPIIIFGDHTRNIKYVDFSFVPGADGTKILCPIGIASEFFYLQLRSYDIESRGYGRHFKILNENLFVVPPLKEQHRIVAKVDELMALCDQLEQQTEASIEAHQVLVTTLLDTLTNSVDADELMQNWARISEHFDTLFTTEESIDQLKQTILQLAVMGKLVPQDPTDEPASELLKRIAEEKAQLVKDKKIKKQKALPPIAEDEKPFELPSGWVWERIDNLSNLIEYGSSQKTVDPFPGGVPVLKMGDIQNGQLILGDHKMMSADVEELPSLYLKNNDILYNRTNSAELVGKTGIFKGEDDKYSFASYLIRIRCNSRNVLPDYINLSMNTPLFRTTQVEPHIKKQCGQANVNGTLMKSMLVSIPPLNEQKQIVSKVNQLISACNSLRRTIEKSRLKQLNIANSIVKRLV
ncbi:restriction endonuclease subunit S [Vibrio alginolyticus]|nr:restriction endonuclease subunit S [Vibrio alginolyticus]